MNIQIEDKVIKNKSKKKSIEQKDVYYNEDTKKYYIVTFLGFNEKGEGEYNLYNLEDACMVYYNNMPIEKLKEIIIKFEYKLVNNPKFIIEGEIN